MCARAWSGGEPSTKHHIFDGALPPKRKISGTVENHFYEICFAIKCCLLVMNGLGKEESILTSKWLHKVCCSQRCRDGFMTDVVPFLYPYIPIHFIEMIFPLVYIL